jgi:acetyl esterase/lipase
MEGNPGAQETFLGEVSDVVAAVKWLRAQPFVDPQQVYVGGHSTGGTLSLLVGASTEVTGVVSFGPIDNVCGYGAERLPFDTSSEEECSVRSPLTYAMQFPPSVIVEGEWGNGPAVRSLGLWPSKNTSYVAIPNCSHFLYVGVLNEFFAQKIAKREALTFTVEQANQLLAEKFPPTPVNGAGWSVTIPPDFEETPGASPLERVFRNEVATIVVSRGDRDPVTCKSTGAIKARGEECFQRQTETDDGDEWLSLTAQRGNALYVTAIGAANDEEWLTAQLNRVLDTAQPVPPDH